MLRGNSLRADRSERRREPCGKYSPRCPCCWRFAARPGCASQAALQPLLCPPITAQAQRCPDEGKKYCGGAETSSVLRTSSAHDRWNGSHIVRSAILRRPCSWRRLSSSVRWVRKKFGVPPRILPVAWRRPHQCWEKTKASSTWRVRRGVQRRNYFSVRQVQQNGILRQDTARGRAWERPRDWRMHHPVLLLPLRARGDGGAIRLDLSAPASILPAMASQAMHRCAEHGLRRIANCSRQVIKSSVSALPS